MTRFDSAVLFAVNSHSGTTRKGSTNPYILHPMETAAIAASLTTDEDMLIAALLHDTIEDAGRSPEEIKEAFGGRCWRWCWPIPKKLTPPARKLTPGWNAKTP